MDKIHILINCFLSYLCLKNIQAQFISFKIAYYHPNTNFGYIPVVSLNFLE